MSDLTTKLNSTLSSVNNIETALENKTGQNLDSTPLSGFDDIINSINILTTEIESFIEDINPPNSISSIATIKQNLINELQQLQYMLES